MNGRVRIPGSLSVLARARGAFGFGLRAFRLRRRLRRGSPERTARAKAAGLSTVSLSALGLALLMSTATPLRAALPAGAADAPPTAEEQARAQRAGSGRLVITAVDTLEGRLPGATVTVTSSSAGQDTEPHLAVTDGSGEVQVDGLPPGEYIVAVELPGFETARVDVRVASGETRRIEAALPIQGFAEEVAVTQEASRARDTDGFSDSLSEEAIDQLPDDPDEMAQLLDELAGGDAEFRVNGFEGGELPPKDQIQAIRIRQDPFAPDSMGAGQPRVEIVTRPGSNNWKHEVNAGFRDQSLDARQAFAPARGDGQTRRLSWSASGPVVKDRASIAARLSTRDSFDAQTIVATNPAGSINDIVNTQRKRLDAEVRVEHALTRSNTLRLEYQHRNMSGENLGVGDFDLRERAYGDERQRQVFRVSTTGTVGTKLFNEFRLELADDRQVFESLSNAVTLNVQNAFVAGGAQRAGGQRNREIEIGTSLEYAPNDRHKMRVGFEGEFGRYTSDRMENAAGTFTFSSLADYEAGRPRQFVRRTGDPFVGFSRYEFSWWVHDDVKLGERVRLGLGLRHDFQKHLDDTWNLAPRVSVSWTPFADDHTTVNAGFGVFNRWFADSVYEQTIRLDGTRQRDLIVRDPSFPDPFDEFAEAEMPPPSIVRTGDVVMERSRRVSVGVEHRVNRDLRLRLNVFSQDTDDRLRAVNVNAPIDGVVPNPAFGRVTLIGSTGSAESRGIDASVRASFADQRVSSFLRYRYTRSYNDADGPFSLPVDATDLAAEWGPASSDVPHRIFGALRTRLPFGFRVNLLGSLSSGRPYTITTGFDDNADTVFNDRPAGVGRNTERGAWQRNVDLRLAWRPLGNVPEGGRGGRRGGGGEGRRGDGGGAVPRGMELYARVSNLFNETNYTRYAGVLTSPFFGQPIAASSPRRLEIGTRVFF
jgi:outer membrane receptor for ferrienterochelin and colicin